MEEKDKIYRFQSLLDESDGSLETIGSAMGLMSNPTQKHRMRRAPADVTQYKTHSI